MIRNKQHHPKPTGKAMIEYDPTQPLHPNPKPYDYVIGIDCGVNTGYAIYDCEERKLVCVETTMIHRAMDDIRHGYAAKGYKIFVRVEDARQVRFKVDPVRAQGAGSVKREAGLWGDFLTDLGIPHEMVRPNNGITKWGADQFKAFTGWQGRTSNHSRDASLLCFKYIPKK